jgi:hypothetical protein
MGDVVIALLYFLLLLRGHLLRRRRLERVVIALCWVLSPHRPAIDSTRIDARNNFSVLFILDPPSLVHRNADGRVLVYPSGQINLPHIVTLIYI